MSPRHDRGPFERQEQPMQAGTAGEVNLVVALDRNVQWGCAVTVRSAIENSRAGTSFHVFVLFEGLSGEDQRALAGSWEVPGHAVRATFVNIELSRWRNLIRSKSLSRMSFARLMIGDLLPAEATRCVYLDTDMLFELDIAELYATDLEGRVIAAVPDGDEAWDAVQLRRLGVDHGRYFNAGLFVADLTRWRELQVGTKALEYCLSHRPRLVAWMKSEPFFHDQDGMNRILAADGARFLPGRWNTWASKLSRYDTPAVIHLIMGPKPWQADYEGLFWDRFYAYLDRTAFAGQRPPNPLGLGPALARVRRRVPYPPAVLRLLRASVNQFVLKR
jgi:lipopolysaccharide biosynthesis glycosyltransferase